MRVEELMTQPVYSCGIKDHANAAAQIMWEHDCGVVPVVDDHGRVAGVITDRDVCMAAHFQNRPLSEIPVAGVMTQQVFTCRPDDEVVDAERLMGERQVNRLPVVDGDGLVIGMLSLADLARQTKRGNGRQREDAVEELAETVTAIREPHRAGAAGSRAN